MNLLGISEDFLRSRKIVDWGYTEASTPGTYALYEEWVAQGLHGDLKYLEDHRKDLRKDLKTIFPEFQSALVFLFSYTPEKKRLQESERPMKLASYVSGFEGMDYHHWIRDRLSSVETELKKDLPELECFYSIDAQPILERDLAYRAGLGWFGKNSMLISKKHGSYTIIGSILLNQKLSLDEEKQKEKFEPDHCGNCTACIDSCPTDAIIDDKVIDASKCISNYTIELFKEGEPPKGFPASSSEIFGCDICQEVCPWNNRPLKSAEIPAGPEWIRFFERPAEEVLKDLEGLSNRAYRKMFKGTPLERTGRVGMMKNLNKLKS